MKNFSSKVVFRQWGEINSEKVLRAAKDTEVGQPMRRGVDPLRQTSKDGPPYQIPGYHPRPGFYG
jgi:hypothetical protein